MDISVGLGPNFVMRLGHLEINHSCKVLAVDDQGEVMFLEKPAHRSLAEVAKVVVAHLRVCGVTEAQVSEAEFVGVEWLLKRSDSTVTSTLFFPESLHIDTRNFLVERFGKFLNHFWRRNIV